MRLGLVIPAVLRRPSLVELTLSALRHFRPDPEWLRRRDASVLVHLAANCLEACGEGELLVRAYEALQGLGCYQGVFVNAGGHRSVAQSWNEGLADLTRSCDVLLVMANDVELHPACVETLVDFAAARPPDVDVWSGCQERFAGAPGTRTDGCDFSLFALTPECVERHGRFDENFRPAYYEDNDYYARVVLAGRQALVVHDARYTHRGNGSQTIALDPEAAHHVRHQFGTNRAYFVRKWGREPLNSAAEVRAHYFPHPFNDPALPLSRWQPPA